MKLFHLLLFLLLYSITYSQIQNDVINNVRDYNFDNARNDIAKIDSSQLAKQLLAYIELSEARGISFKKSSLKNITFSYDSINKKSIYVKSLYQLNRGVHELFYNESADNKAFLYLNEALKSALKIQDKPLICEIIKAFLFYFKTVIIIDDSTYTSFLNLYEQYLYDEKEQLNYFYHKIIIPFQRSSDSETIRKLIPDLFHLSKQNLPKPYLGEIYLRIGNYYQIENKMLDSAKVYYKKALSLFQTPTKGYEIEEYIKYKSNLVILLTELGEYKESNQILFNLKKNYIGKSHNRNKIYLDYYISKNFFMVKKFDSAYIYLNKSRRSQFMLNQNLHLTSLNEINTKYETEKKEKEIIQQKNIIKNNQYLIFGSLALLLAISIIGFLVAKNSKRKRLLAEKNNEIEQQKVITLLKEQELTSIDAMIEGQEKERKRIAEDLHDDLGSVLTTLKLHFENYKVNKDKQKFSEGELIDKTDELLDEAYKKVRSIAHAKNSGVIANQGLLLAIENMAEKVSSSKKIKIEVVNHGLENRLENSLELTIFRVIQELITNIIKHAEASQATIHIINHEKSLNIMVEDNGKGFDTSKISSKGMGIHSIDKRIEHLDGTMTIESEINKGTTVIIDIPL